MKAELETHVCAHVMGRRMASSREQVCYKIPGACNRLSLFGTERNERNERNERDVSPTPHGGSLRREVRSIW